MRLKALEKRLLLRASRIPIETYFDQRSSHFRSTKWLNKNNRYRKSCTRIYQNDAYSANINNEQIVSYISASAITHIIDGWSYLGRSIDALLRGDAYRSVHLAYYAELRAAMGLLGAEGIGAFSSFHSVIDQAGLCHPFPKQPTHATNTRNGMQTHNFVWLALEHWAGLKKAGDLLDSTVMPASLTLSSWMSAVGISKPLQPLAKRWLETWGVDLSVISDDRNLRNLASYRPAEFRKPEYLPIFDILEFVEKLWQLFEPNNGRFINLENCLLRKALRELGGGNINLSSLTSLGFSDLDSRNWIAFLNTTIDPLPLQLAANKNTTIEDKDCHLQVVSRATMLLFVASSIARKLLVKAGYSQDDLEFWWSSDGEGRGMWEYGNKPSDMTDLWADVRDSIQESEKWRSDNKGRNFLLKDLQSSHSEILSNLGRFELVGMWAIMP